MDYLPLVLGFIATAVGGALLGYVGGIYHMWTIAERANKALIKEMDEILKG